MIIKANGLQCHFMGIYSSFVIGFMDITGKKWETNEI
jgi:hypothetical protein